MSSSFDALHYRELQGLTRQRDEWKQRAERAEAERDAVADLLVVGPGKGEGYTIRLRVMPFLIDTGGDKLGPHPTREEALATVLRVARRERGLDAPAEDPRP